MEIVRCNFERNLKIGEKMTDSISTYSYDEAFEKSKQYFNGDELAAKVFVDKYALRDKKENILEDTPDKMHRRIAKEFARIEKNKFKKPMSENEVYKYLKDFKYIVPGGSGLSGIGDKNKYVSLSNCFVGKSPLDSYSSICKTDEEVVSISKRRGGIGFDMSNLRPEGTPTSNASNTSTGIVPFCERYSNTIREVGQAGRRGALILTLSVHHPEIMNFITMKQDLQKINGANISVKLTDEFLNAVEKDEEYEQRWPIDSDSPTISNMVPAKKVWNQIVKSAWKSAEPGILLWDNIIRESPADCYPDFQSISTNPCCFSQSHEVFVLTQKGIKEIKEISSSDKIWINESKEWVGTSGYFAVGKKDIYKVEFSNKEILFITDNHKLSKVDRKREKTVYNTYEGKLTELKDLNIGDRISVHTSKIKNTTFANIGSYEEGLIMGWLSGDGCLSYHSDGSNYPSIILDFWQGEYDIAKKMQIVLKKIGYNLKLMENKKNGVKKLRTCKLTEDFTNKYQINIWEFRSKDKINPFLFNCSIDFIKGYLSTLFSADGTVQINTVRKSYGMSLASINKKKLIQVKNLLLYFGIKSSVSIMKKASEVCFKKGQKKYKTKICYRLSISGIINLKRFKKYIGFYSDRKQETLNLIDSIETKHKEKGLNFITIKNIEKMKDKHKVGCIDVEKYHKFTANGIISGNSELPLSERDSCRLLLLNSYSFVEKPFTKNAKFNFEKFYRYAQVAQRLMDNLIDLEIENINNILRKINNDPEPEEIKRDEIDLWKAVKKACRDGRRTGTGLNAIGDTIAACGLKYGSEQSIDLIEQIFKTLKLGCYRASVDMSKELGPFKCWNHELEKNNPFLLRIKNEDAKLWKDMKKYGRRNIGLLTMAPSGSVSILTKTTSGIEPLFKTSYMRRKKININDENIKVDFIDDSGDRWQNFEVTHPQIETWKNITKEKDIKKSPWYGCCAEDIDWGSRVRLQATANKYIDHSISATVNLPENATIEDISNIYTEAWKSGCKGITVYRKNCRTGVIIDKDISNNTFNIVQTNSPKRPKSLPCDVYHPTVKGEKYFVIIGLLDNKQPYEVFAGKNKDFPQNIKKAVITRHKRGEYRLCDIDKKQEIIYDNISDYIDEEQEAITRLISSNLRHGCGISFIVHQLEKTRGDLMGFAKAVCRILKKYIPENTEVSGEECPDCRGKLIRIEGCMTCTCGFSKCG